MGSPAFAIPTLDALIKAKHEIAAVYCQAPKPAGRGQKITPCPVHAFAEQNNLPVVTPQHFYHQSSIQKFRDFQPDIAVVVAYGLILPKSILEIPKYGCINLHPSLLPRWRGATPIQRPIIAGDKETAATIMKMDEGCDTGPVLLYKKVPITDETTTADLQEKLSHLGAELMVHTIVGLQAGIIKPITQAKEGVTLAPKLNKDDGRLEWQRPAADLDRLVRGLNPWPAAFFDFGGERIKVHKAKVIEFNHITRPGEVVLDHTVSGMSEPCVATGIGLLRLDILQRPNRKPMTAAEVLSALSIKDGTILS